MSMVIQMMYQTGHVILTFDIEVEMNSGLPCIRSKNAMTSVAFHDSATNDYYVYVVNEGDEINKTIKGAKGSFVSF
jgi:hypothetical protein